MINSVSFLYWENFYWSRDTTKFQFFADADVQYSRIELQIKSKFIIKRFDEQWGLLVVFASLILGAIFGGDAQPLVVPHLDGIDDLKEATRDGGDESIIFRVKPFQPLSFLQVLPCNS